MTESRNPNDLEYPLRIEFDKEEQVFEAEFTDLPGCSAYGDTVAEVYERALQAKKEWMRITREQGLPIPPPSTRDEHSGRILLRLPTSLHALLADRSKLRGASLNQYLVHLLSGALVGDSVEASINELRTDLASCERRIVSHLYQLPHSRQGSILISDALNEGSSSLGSIQNSQLDLVH